MIGAGYVESELAQRHNWTKTGRYSVTNELFLDLVFTDKCNCSCPFCISRTKEYAKDDFAKWKDSFKQTLDIFDIKNLIILGGESTVDERFFERLEFIHSVIKHKKINNVILTTNGIRLKDKKTLQSIIDSDINAVNISYMNYDKAKNDRIFGNNTLTRGEIREIYSELKRHAVNMRLNTNVYRGNVDSLSEMESSYR